MQASFKVVDLFAGPGGLAEGFSAFRVDGRPGFDVCLSVEKETSAFKTLRLRSFLRQFSTIPDEYYDYIAGNLSRKELKTKYQEQWEAARRETCRLELGAPGTDLELDPILETIRKEAAGNAVLVGGPPCQAYSLVGRARNSGNATYNPGEDKRHFLYREYIRIIGKLRPAAFVMENVKGFLSSKIDGERIFSRVLEDLRSAGGTPQGYRIIPLVAGRSRNGQEFVLRAEDFGVPQRRHRVILFGIRSDLAPPEGVYPPRLVPRQGGPVVRDVLQGMTPLRSGLSKSKDDDLSWRDAAVSAFSVAASSITHASDERLVRVRARLHAIGDELSGMAAVPPRSSKALAPVRHNQLAQWLIDPKLRSLPNHETRGHMEGDLARYAFASTFAEITGRSPKADEFPKELAPDHDNWASGKFADRFRVQCWDIASTTVTSHISKDGHYFIHPDPLQCRSLTVREAARLQTFPDNYFFEGNRTEQYVQVGNAVPPLLALKIASVVFGALCPDHVQDGLENEERQSSLPFHMAPA